MSLKETAILGAVGAASIYIVRTVGGPTVFMDQGVPQNKGTLPIIPADFMLSTNGGANWSLAFTLIPAALAYYLSN